MVSSAYLRLLIFLPAILIPACASSSPVFLLMYSAYKLNKQGNSIQPWQSPFPIWNQPGQHIKKQRHYFANKGPSRQGYGFPSNHVRMWQLDLKIAECRGIDAFEVWCWRKLLRIPWTARRSNQSILKKISPGCSLEGLMLKVKFQYFGHLMRRADSFEKTLMLGKFKGKGRRGR